MGLATAVNEALTLRRARPSAPVAAASGAAQVERDAAVVAAVRALPPRRRAVVFLRYFADLTYAEIAEACGIREGTVAAVLAQAHEQLRALLDSEEVLRP